MRRRLLSILLALCLVLALLPGTALAGDYWETYLAGDQVALELYQDIRTWSDKAARGEIAETTVTFSNSEPQSVTGSALGAAISKVMDYIFLDRPPEMYWYDSTSSYYAEYSADGRSSWSVKFYFPVSVDYRDRSGSNPFYTVDPSKARNAWSAVTRNARAIVAANAGKSDYEKLVAYRDKICELVAYNFSAVKYNYPYGDPWQMIHVFDHTNPSTSKQVVCEGYAKAFQYLCDLTTFRGDVACYTVTGLADGEGHMWNIVRIGGKNYIADVTPCDGTQALGALGKDGYMPAAPDKLFLAGAAVSNGGRSYTVSFKDTYGQMNHWVYSYHDETMKVYDSSVLTIARSNYVPSAAARTYTVTFNANGGSVSTAEKDYEEGDTLGTLPTPTRTGYKFGGWYTASTGGTKVTASTKVTADMTLYARWTQNTAAKTYTITLNANSGTVSPSSLKVESGKTYYSSLPTPTRSGYKFDGWYTARTGGSQITASTKATANRTIYAHWTRSAGSKTYQVHFDPNGGSVYQDMKVVFRGIPYRALPTPTRPNYHFKGWYTKKSGGTKVTETTRVNLTANQTLYAQWQSAASLKSTERRTFQVTVPAYYELALYSSNTSAKAAAAMEFTDYQTITCTQKATLSNGAVRYYGKVNNRNYWFTYSCEMEVN